MRRWASTRASRIRLAREEIVRYYRYLEKNDALLRGSRPHAEVLLLYPRTRVHEGDVAAVDDFQASSARNCSTQHVLFDVLPDDRLTPTRRARYRAVLGAERTPRKLPAGLSRFKAPATVRVSAGRPAAGGEVTLHFVNYNREEPKKKRSRGRGIKDEKPIAVEGVAADFVLPAGAKVTRVLVSSPESPDAVEVKHTVEAGRVRFTMPKFLVYAIARVEWKKE